VTRIGEICISNPGVFAGQYLPKRTKNIDLYFRTNTGGQGIWAGHRQRPNTSGITGRAQRPDQSVVGPQHRSPAEIEDGLFVVTKRWPLAGAIGSNRMPTHGEVARALSNWLPGRRSPKPNLLEFCKEARARARGAAQST